ncbi:tRNA pseudouridine synthase-like 1 isoform X2 [Rhagoletis pomonella]|uniref:tRNA pseudouridine synthase-like 1 isoform X2 n=1 Tax=Rhagoletis pomonella TaxID=28610 RepID=UPI00177FF52C|nr:tRNA pseudouridine synthase-like 1 isoform X2 [Rhagoletis pomonella]
MNRFLLNISYIGTNFRGIQKTFNKADEARVDTKTIQGCIELGLRALHPINEIQTVLSSRTDAGVHALHSTLHVDLQRRNSEPFDPTTITCVLNSLLHKNGLPIRVLSTQQVPENFHCRYNALGRTYLYRFAVAKGSNRCANPLKNHNFYAFLPVEEIDRCFFLQNSNFDIERLRSGTRMFLGLHNFRTFMNVSRQHSPTRDHPRYTLRVIDEINVKPGKSVAIGANAEKSESLYHYWDIEFKAKSFLYKQVRRMVGALLALATGRIDERSIYEMLTIPSKNSWDNRVLLSPPYGLYLCRVHYNEKDLELPKNTNKNELSTAASEQTLGS